MRWLGWICLAMTVVCLGLRCLAVAMGDPLGVRMAATHLRIDALFLGVGIRALAQFAPDRFAALRGWRVGLIVLGILLWTPNFVIAPDTPWIRTVGLTGTLLGAGALLVGVFHTRASDFGRLATGVAAVSGVLAWVGTDSYAIYLWHVTLFGILEQRVVPHLGALAAPATLLGWALSAGVVCLVAILFGAAASRVVEWPVLRLRDRYFPSRSGTLPPTRQQAVRPRSPIPTEAGSYPQPLAEVGPEPANPGT
jgi:peptidoglycan/LPS O-acetylase OafA/YrhL